MKPRTHSWLLITILTLTLALPALAAESPTKRQTRQWTKLQAQLEQVETDSEKIELLEKFIRKYSGSPYVDQAWDRIARIRFNRAGQEGTPEAYLGFIALHPEHPLAEKARDRTLRVRFNRARRLDTLEALQEFLALHPDGSAADQARERVAELAFRTAEQKGTIEAYEKFLLDYPRAPQAERALARIDEERLWRSVREENNRPAYSRYMSRFPGGRYRGQAYDRYNRLSLLERLEPLLGAWAIVEHRIPPDLKRPRIFLYMDTDGRVMFFQEARQLHGGDPVATSITAMVDGPEVRQDRLWDSWMRSVLEVDGQLEIEEYSLKYPDIRNRDRYKLAGGRLTSDRLIREGLPYREEYELVARFGTEKFLRLLERSQAVSIDVDTRHRVQYRP